MDNEQKGKRYHLWWWTVEPRHAPCAQCSEKKKEEGEQAPRDLVWGDLGYMLSNEK